MKQLLVAITLSLIAVTGCSPAPSTTFTPVPSLTQNAGPIATATLGTTQLAQLERDYLTTAQKTFKVDLSCSPICWRNFKPGQITFEEVVKDIGTRTVQDELNSPRNITGFGTSGFSVTAFSDDSSPKPLLRAFLVRLSELPFGIDIPGTDTRYDALLPNELVERAGIPIKIITSIPSSTGSVYIVLEYAGWAIQYSGGVDMKTTPKLWCPYKRIPSIYLWVYTNSETSFTTMLQSFKQYDKVDVSGLNLPFMNQFSTVTERSKIEQILNEIKTTKCLTFS